MLPKINKAFIQNNIINNNSKVHPEFEYLLRFDGCSKGNPGLAGCGAVIYQYDKEIWYDTFFVGEKATNNHAEYAGLLLGLQQAIAMGIKTLRVEGDSQLVINHMKGIYKCKSINLIELYDKAKYLEKRFDKIEYFHIYRKDNKRADYLSNLAINNDLHDENLYIYDDNDNET